ncbi:MAG TPA: 3-isopropylmalate dehydratase large subunit [Nitrospirae bacterium]|nr:3-isopropylmalate dehydratase large subunit [Nitrospirota bacterium]
MGKTLFRKLLDPFIVVQIDEKTVLVFVNRHPGHEVTSPVPFDIMRVKGSKPPHPELCFFVGDHNTSTMGGWEAIVDKHSLLQLETLDKNCGEFGIICYGLGHHDNGVIHSVVPGLGIALPGDNVRCGDSHTTTYGGIGVLSSGVGSSEVHIMFETQCLEQKISDTMRITINGKLNQGVTSKDVILYIIGQIGTSGGTGKAIEFAGEVFRDMSVLGRLIVCNMAKEMGAKFALVAVDDKTIEYAMNTRGFRESQHKEERFVYWQTLHSDPDAVFDTEHEFNASDILPQVTWGTSPDQVIAISDSIPVIDSALPEDEKKHHRESLKYMQLKEGTKMSDVEVQSIFIGSCTLAGIEDLREAAGVVKGKKIASNIEQALVVPPSMDIKRQAEGEGLDRDFIEAGFEWRNPGCSACLAMNADKVPPGKRCASTSNRPFEGRQGPDSMTHLVSALTAAKAAIDGHFSA